MLFYLTCVLLNYESQNLILCSSHHIPEYMDVDQWCASWQCNGVPQLWHNDSWVLNKETLIEVKSWHEEVLLASTTGSKCQEPQIMTYQSVGREINPLLANGKSANFATWISCTVRRWPDDIHCWYNLEPIGKTSFFSVDSKGPRLRISNYHSVEETPADPNVMAVAASILLALCHKNIQPFAVEEPTSFQRIHYWQRMEIASRSPKGSSTLGWNPLYSI